MPLLKKNDSTLSVIKEKSIDLERHIQKLTEANLSCVFSLEFVSTDWFSRAILLKID